MYFCTHGGRRRTTQSLVDAAIMLLPVNSQEAVIASYENSKIFSVFSFNGLFFGSGLLFLLYFYYIYIIILTFHTLYNLHIFSFTFHTFHTFFLIDLKKKKSHYQ